MIDFKKFECVRIEVVKKAYDKSGKVIEEQWEYYYPKLKAEHPIGFKVKNNYAKD